MRFIPEALSDAILSIISKTWQYSIRFDVLLELHGQRKTNKYLFCLLVSNMCILNNENMIGILITRVDFFGYN